MKYKPQTKKKKKELVQDDNIYLGDIDTVLITDMSHLFECSKRKNFEGLENWNISNVTDISYMFLSCENFNNNINNWDTSNVKNFFF